MIADILTFLVATFLLWPLQSGLESRLAAARAPAAVVQQVEACAGVAVPALVERATADPWWAVSTGLRAWIGTASPEAVLGTLRLLNPQFRSDASIRSEIGRS
jgi:hypothetical protein